MVPEDLDHPWEAMNLPEVITEVIMGEIILELFI